MGDKINEMIESNSYFLKDESSQLIVYSMALIEWCHVDHTNTDIIFQLN